MWKPKILKDVIQLNEEEELFIKVDFVRFYLFFIFNVYFVVAIFYLQPVVQKISQGVIKK